MVDTAAARKRLLALKAEIEALERGSAEGRQPVELDQQSVGRVSRMDAIERQAMALAVQERRRRELLRIDAALARIEAGDYGFCVSCDEEIEEKRLALDPAVPTCFDCASG